MSVKVIDVNAGIFEANDEIAAQVRSELKEKNTALINLMASPGAGKTTTLRRLLSMLKEDYKIGVMEADIASTVDADKIERDGVFSIQVHTGGECAMDAAMTQAALASFDYSQFDLLVLENVGNLVCPAETDTGATLNMCILSVPEGDDKPLKYPLMFTVCDLVLINKIDTREYFPFDDAAVVERIKKLNPNVTVLFVSAKTGEGFEEVREYIKGCMSYQ